MILRAAVAAAAVLFAAASPVAAATSADLAERLEEAGFTCVPVDGSADTWCDRQGTGEGVVVILPASDAAAPAGSIGSGGPDPWSPEIAAFGRDLVEVVCPASVDQLEDAVAEARGQAPPAQVDRTVAECSLSVLTLESPDEPGRVGQVTVEVSGVAAGESAPPSASIAPVPSTAVGPIPSGGGAPGETPGTAGGSADDEDRRPAFAGSVPAPADISTEPVTVATSALLAALLVFLMPFPAALFNSTLEANHDEIRGWFRLRRGSTTSAEGAGFWATPLGVGAFLLLSAVLFGFLDPGFGTSESTVTMLLGTLLGLVLVLGASAALPWLAHHRAGDGGRLRALPLTIVVAIACVLVSRVTGFLPGYLYGLIITVEFARAFGDREEGRLAARATALLLGLAGLAWLLVGAIRSASVDGVLWVVLETALSAVVVAGFEGVVFGLIPLRFLPGAAIRAWSRPAWAGLYAIGAFGFFHVLVNPDSGYLASTERTPLATVLALLAGFGVASVTFWAWFRFRQAPDLAP